MVNLFRKCLDRPCNEGKFVKGVFIAECILCTDKKCPEYWKCHPITSNADLQGMPWYSMQTAPQSYPVTAVTGVVQNIDVTKITCSDTYRGF